MTGPTWLKWNTRRPALRTDGGAVLSDVDAGLKFDSGPSMTLTVAYRDDTLAATIRYDDEKGIEGGDTLALLSAHTGERMGTADVVHVETVEVRNALDVVDEYDAEYGIDSTEYLISRLGTYYDAGIYQTTTVKVIILKPEL